MNPQNRTKSGLFKKGVSGNPGGRPKTPEIFKRHTIEAQKTVLALMQSEDEDIQLKAATLVLAYSLGRPTENVTHSGMVSLEQILGASR